jgi:hypothetical protein
MSYIYEKVHTEVIEIEKVKRNFMKHHSFSVTRKDKPNCELCDKPFSPDDDTNLAFIKNTYNKLICNDCADKVISGGAEEIDWNKKN